MKGFSGLHPAVCFVFFVEVLLLTMIQMHPVLQAVSVGMALATLWALGGLRALLEPQGRAGAGDADRRGKCPLKSWRCNHPVPLTWGAVLYPGIAAVGRQCGHAPLAVILWFRSFHLVMTQDKIMFLFGRGIPTLSLLFCMTLRFVPEFTRQLWMLSQARASMGLGLEQCRAVGKKSGAGRNS